VTGHRLASSQQEHWVPLPFIGAGYVRCYCGQFCIGGWYRRGRGRRRYERHYRRAHLRGDR